MAIQDSVESYIEIKTQEEMDCFFDSVNGFHDGLIKEFHLINDAYIDKHLSMVCGFKYNMRILIQRQWEKPSAVELLLGDVVEMNLPKLNYEIYNSFGTIHISKANETPEITINLDGNVFVCRKMLYREVSEWMGRESRFGDEIIVNNSFQLEKLEDGWVLCSNCLEAWQPINRKVLKCPKCFF
ncbi:hypothetical protein AB4Z17_28950 [Paenibacillus sp. TAF43_2]|uniref:hypothetical protein n=1 Tax=Paenibacillus sp. TAF43_2 TaxID=3233069 RepID=UPI003F9AE77A